MEQYVLYNYDGGGDDDDSDDNEDDGYDVQEQNAARETEYLRWSNIFLITMIVVMVVMVVMILRILAMMFKSSMLRGRLNTSDGTLCCS